MNSPDNFWILRPCGEDDSAIIDYLPEDSCPESRKLRDMKPIAGEFPVPTILEFSEGSPKRIKLYDFVDNTLSLLIISDKVKQVFDSLEMDRLEYIPININDHQGDLAADNYFILNVLDKQPIIDMEKSKYRMNPLIKTKIQKIKDLHLDVTAIDPKAKLFYASTELRNFFITDEVLKAMHNAGITGIQVIKAEGWNGQTLSFT